MKSSKLFLLAAVFTFAMVGAVNADHNPSLESGKKVLYLSFEEAIQIPQLVVAMHQQLDDSFLSTGEQTYYTQDVYYQNLIVRITGSYMQWKLFFRVNINIGVEGVIVPAER